jgi:hypothetical protein
MMPNANIQTMTFSRLPGKKRSGWCGACARTSKQFFGRPAFLASVVQALIAHTEFLGPVRQRHGSSVERNLDRASGVAGLLRRWNPYAIFLAVVSVAVFALYGHLSWAWTHIRIKSSEVMPFLANLYAAPAVPFIAIVFWVVTALKHAGPNHVDRSSCYTVGSEFVMPSLAPTRFSIPIPQAAGLWSHFFSADALAQPIMILSSFPGVTDCGQISELFSRHHGLLGSPRQSAHFVSVGRFHNLYSITSYK